jgi:SAM-dependent methyltransferase
MKTTCLFDEHWYCDRYADVKDAVAKGIFTSGRDHYCQFGASENRFSCAAAEKGELTARSLHAASFALSEAERRQRVGAVWSAQVDQATTGWYWMAHPMVQARLNTLASGDPGHDSYDRLVTVLQERGVALPLECAVSIGCGFGALERDLASRGIVREIDAYDIASGALAEAQRLAQEGGFTGLRYHVADLEVEFFNPGTVDAVFAHQSIHHVERLDELFSAVSAILKPGGIFHLHEFVGPIRFQWTDAQIELVNRFLRSLPPRLRTLPTGQPRALQSRPTVPGMIAADPSEAIRSSEIIPRLRRHFNIIEERPLGGALLHLGLGGIAQNFDPASTEDSAIMEAFFAAEDVAIRDGVVGSDFTVVIAVKSPCSSYC